MKHYPYVNIMLDAGAVLTKQIVRTIIANPFRQVPPTPMPATGGEESDWRIEDYVTEMSSVLAEMKSRGELILVATCHDRLLQWQSIEFCNS